MAKVSIITASYNYAEYIGQAIESVMNQTFTDWEMIVVDDGSKDNSTDIIKEYTQKDNRIKLITHSNNENRGLVETLKLGISQAHGEYIVFLESDDYIREDYIEKKLNVFKQYPNVGLVYNKIQLFGAVLPKKLLKWLNRVNRYWAKHNYVHNVHQLFSIENYIPTFSCVMIKNELFQNIDWACPNPAWIDIWLWFQISKNNDIYCYQEELTYWRMHNDSYIYQAVKDPINGYNFYKTLLFDDVLDIRDLNYKIIFYYKKIIRLIVYKFWCIKQNLANKK